MDWTKTNKPNIKQITHLHIDNLKDSTRLRLLFLTAKQVNVEHLHSKHVQKEHIHLKRLGKKNSEKVKLS